MEKKGAISSQYARLVVVLFLIVAVMISTVFLQIGIDDSRAKIGATSNNIELGTSTALEFLGGFRTAIAAYLWIKIDRIHDNYYGSLTEDEDELIPLYRLVTWLDPQFIDAYYVGSYLLYVVGEPKEGWRFASEGLRLNPESSKMELNVGQIALIYKKDYSLAVAHLERAYALSQNKAERIYILSTLKAAYRKSGQSGKAQRIDKILSDPVR